MTESPCAKGRPPGKHLASPVPGHSRCSRGFIHGLLAVAGSVLAGCEPNSSRYTDPDKDVVEAVELLRVGSFDDSTTAFGLITGLDWGPRGRIRVGDALTHRILEFDRSGKLLRSFGSKGEGPGEFVDISGLVSLGGDFVVADRQTNRFSLFDSTGMFVRSIRRGLLGAPMPWKATALDSMTILDFFPALDGSHVSFVPVEVNLSTGGHDTLPPISFPYRPARGVPVLFSPYRPMLHWTVDEAGGLWYGVNDALTISRRQARGGDVDTVLFLDTPREVMDPNDHRRLLDSAAALGRHVDPGLLPRVLPAFGAIWPLGDGSIALLRTRKPFPETPESVVDVYDDNKHVGSAHLGLAWRTTYRIRGRQVLGVAEDASGVQYAVVLELRRRPDTRTASSCSGCYSGRW